MEENFEALTTAKIDANLHREILKKNNIKDWLLIIVFLIVLYIFKPWFGYWLNFGMPHQTGISTTTIDTKRDPIQIDYTPSERKARTFKYTSLITSKEYTLIPFASFELSGLVTAYNRQSIISKNEFDNAALYDLGVAWGDLANKELFKEDLKCFHEKSGELLLNSIYVKSITRPAPLKKKYIDAHFSHSRIIPANKNIMAALLSIKKWDTVKFYGELVDIKYTDIEKGTDLHYKTSLKRTDNNETSRGLDASEIFYVTKVQIGNKIYK